MRLLCRLSGVLRYRTVERRHLCSNGAASQSDFLDDQTEVSEAMKKYLRETEDFEDAVENQRRLYEESLASLAIMMNKNPEEMSREAVKDAVAYLFPSSLYSSRGRPKLVPPEESHPARKSLQCSIDGRPLHSLFYTKKANFYGIMHEAASILYELQETEDIRKRQALYPSKKAPKLRLNDTEWMTLTEIQQTTLERVTETDYGHMKILMERIVKHPLSLMASEFINRYRIRRYISETSEAPPEVQVDTAECRRFVHGYGQRKRAFAEARLWLNGSGKIAVNDQRLLAAFPYIGDREQLLSPLVFTKQLGKLDIEIKTSGEGSAAQSGACRLAIARALTSISDKSVVHGLHLAGYLTPDMRFNEKKKGGLHGARKRFIWKRR